MKKNTSYSIETLSLNNKKERATYLYELVDQKAFILQESNDKGFIEFYIIDNDKSLLLYYEQFNSFQDAYLTFFTNFSEASIEYIEDLNHTMEELMDFTLEIDNFMEDDNYEFN